MSAFDKTVAAIRDVLLLREQVSRLRGDLADLAGDVTGLVGDMRGLEQRVARIEGYIDGRAAAAATQRRLADQ